MDELLTLEQAAEWLHVSRKTVERRIHLTRDGRPGGWPTGTFLNLTPNAGRALYRIRKQALLSWMQEQSA